ncbi:hypothetical protein ACLKA6_005601 [Drosophila palustris]
MSLASRISLASTVKLSSDAGRGSGRGSGSGSCSEINVSQRNENIRNLFAPSPATLAKRKAERQRSQSSVCLERQAFKPEQKKEQEQEQVQKHDLLPSGNQMLRRSMGQIGSYNGDNMNTNMNMNNGDYHTEGESKRLGSDGPGINQLTMTRNQSAVRQYNGVNSNSMGRHDNNNSSNNNNSHNNELDFSNNGWHRSSVELATGQLQKQNSVNATPRRPSSVWQGARNQPENSINSSMEKHQQWQQQQQQPQELQELNNNNNNNVDYGNEMTWGNATEKSQRNLSHWEILHDAQSLPAGKAVKVKVKADKKQGIYPAAPAYNYYEHEDDDDGEEEDKTEEGHANGHREADEVDKLQLHSAR